MLLNESNIFLLKFAGQRGVLVGIASGVVELALRCAGVKRIVVHDHVIGATLETESLLVLVLL